MKTYFCLLCSLLFLSACGTSRIEQHDKGNFFTVKKEAWLEVRQEITIPAEQTRAFLQNGEVIEVTALDLYSTSCELEVYQRLPISQTILAGKFFIQSTSSEESPIVFHPAYKKELKLSSNQKLAQTPSDTKRYWRFNLRSEQQPQVMYMVCRGPQDAPWQAKLPSFKQMQQSVGQYIDLHLF